MKFTSSLPGVTVTRASSAGRVTDPGWSAEDTEASQSQFFLKVNRVGEFFAGEGKNVRYSPAPGADPAWVRLYLEGQVLVALLHQRKIINFHASSFIYDNKGVMILGATGSGKTSLTVAFALKGSAFLTDDLTPVIFNDGRPALLSLDRRVKIRAEAAEQLGIEACRLTEAEKGTGKKYLSIEPAAVHDHPLDIIFRISVGNVTGPRFSEPAPSEGFSILRSEICSWEMLAGMPTTEEAYLQQLVKIVEKVRIIDVVRPPEITISDLSSAVEGYLNSLAG
jgi:hypothetical protein